MKKNICKKLLLALSFSLSICCVGCNNNTVSQENEPVIIDSSIPEEQTIDTIPADEPATTESSEPEEILATLVAYSADVDASVWLEKDIDIRYPDAVATTPSWNQTLPITLWGKKDVIATIPAPLTSENIANAGYQLTTADGSSAALISDDKATSYAIGYLNNNQLDYAVAALDIETLFEHKDPSLQHVLSVLGTPDFGFAYNTLEARYYYLYEEYYLEISFYKEKASQKEWMISEVLYIDASSFLNDDFSQEINRVKESGINGFSSDYHVPTEF